MALDLFFLGVILTLFMLVCFLGRGKNRDA